MLDNTTEEQQGIEYHIRFVLTRSGGKPEDIDHFINQVRDTECHDLYADLPTEEIVRDFELETHPHKANKGASHPKPGDHGFHGWVMCSHCHHITTEDDATFGNIGALDIPQPYCRDCAKALGIKFNDLSDNTFILKPRLRAPKRR